MDWKLSKNSGSEAMTLTTPELETRTAAGSADREEDWLCAWCHHRVASERNRFSFENQSEFTFANPNGIRFHILTFSPTLGCQQSGVPTLENTWFSGHAWSFCHCERCGQHLGWHYTGPHNFAGLIAERIVRAQCVWN